MFLWLSWGRLHASQATSLWQTLSSDDRPDINVSRSPDTSSGGVCGKRPWRKVTCFTPVEGCRLLKVNLPASTFTLQGSNISPLKVARKMMLLFHSGGGKIFQNQLIAHWLNLGARWFEFLGSQNPPKKTISWQNQHVKKTPENFCCKELNPKKWCLHFRI